MHITIFFQCNSKNHQIIEITGTPRKKFSLKHDIDLLFYVTAVNPFVGDASNKWCEIAESFMEIYSHRRKEMQGADISPTAPFSRQKNEKNVQVRL